MEDSPSTTPPTTPPPPNNPVDLPLLPLLLLEGHTSPIPTTNSSSTKGRLQGRGLGSTLLLPFLLTSSSSSTHSTSTHKINGVRTASSRRLLPNRSKEGIEAPGEDKGRDRMRAGREEEHKEGMEPSMVARGSMAMGLIMACNLDKEEEQEWEDRRDRRWVLRLKGCGGA